jgi:predicted molibdopterin-dependent oxidoreductase YjgC
VRKAIQPIGDSKEDWVIICELAKKMGAQGFDFASPSDVMSEINRLTPSYGGITFERLEELGSLQWPCPTLEHAGTSFLHKGKFARGLGKFFALPFKEPAELTDDEYPFTLTTGRLMFHFHTGSMTRRSPKLNSEVPEAYVEINVKDAQKIGLNGHKYVRVSSRRGQIELGVRITDDIKRGVIFIPFHFAEAAANKLTNSAIDPVAKIPEYKVCAVKVELAEKVLVENQQA